MRYKSALFLALLSSSAMANTNVINWHNENTTADQLVADGYELKSVNLWIDTELLYFQKGKSVFRCGTTYGKDKDTVQTSKCQKLAAQ